MLLLSGCELFTTREPEPPTGASGGDWVFPSEPCIVLDNLQSAVGRRSSVDYMRSFGIGAVESFSFIPDPKTNANFPGRFDGWDLARERKFVESIFTKVTLPNDSIAELNLEVDRSTELGDSAEITARYNLHLGHDLDEGPREMEGRAEFSLRRGNDGGWRIGTWTDFRSIGSCLSDLKRLF